LDATTEIQLTSELIDINSTGAITANSATTMTLQATTGVDLDTGLLDIDATGNIDVDGVNITMNSTGVTKIDGYQYPDIVANAPTAGWVMQTTAGGVLTLGELSLETLLNNNPSSANDNQILKRVDVGDHDSLSDNIGAWQYVYDFRRLYQDAEPMLGASLNVNGYEITSTLGTTGTAEAPDVLSSGANGANIIINPHSSGDIILGNEVDSTIKVRAADGDELTIVSGYNSGATDGEDLIIGGGTSDTGEDGVVILGQNSVSEAILEAPVSKDMRLRVSSNQNIWLGADAAVTGAVIGPDATAIASGDLTISGGESFNPETVDGGDLILTGGQSALGQEGSIIFDSPVIFTSTTPTVGEVYPINFFISDLITTGSNPSIVLDGYGVTEATIVQPGGHVAHAAQTSAVLTTYDIINVGSLNVGTVQFTAGVAAGVVSITNPNLAAGAILHIVNPALPDATIGNITITLRTITT